MIRTRWAALAALSVVALLVAPGAVASSPVAVPTVVRTTAVDNTTVTFDVLGQRIDAHDGDLLQTPDGTIYLYGTAYGCGFRLMTPGTSWCGVRVYTTRDLQTWTPAGGVGGMYALDHLDGDWQSVCAPPAYGCYRPHVVQRPSDGVYVMWLNTHGDAGYRILTSATPGGPFVDTGIIPTLAVQPPTGGLRYGDMDVTIAPDGRGYLTYTTIWPGTNEHTLVIEQLDPTLTTGTGRHVVIDAHPGVDLIEAPGLFYGPNGAWYLTYSDPARPYLVTGTGIVNGPRNTPDPIGAWSFPRSLIASSCSGQPSGVWPIRGPSGVTTWVYGSDRWVPGDTNQAKANNYYGALTFGALGGTAIDAYYCQSAWLLP